MRSPTAVPGLSASVFVLLTESGLLAVAVLPVLAELFAVLEVKFILAALLGRTCNRVPVLGGVAKDGGAELFIHENAGADGGKEGGSAEKREVRWDGSVDDEVQARYACVSASSKFSSSGLRFMELIRSLNACFSAYVCGGLPSCCGCSSANI